MICAAVYVPAWSIVTKVIRFISSTIVLKQVRVTDERVARISIWSIENACVSIHFWSIEALEPWDCVIDLANIYAFILTTMLIAVVVGCVSVSKLAIHRLEETEVSMYTM